MPYTRLSKVVEMAQKRVNISIDEELNKQWARVAKKHGLTKSGMVEEWLQNILPILDEEQPKKVLQNAMKALAKEIDTTANLFE